METHDELKLLTRLTVIPIQQAVSDGDWQASPQLVQSMAEAGLVTPIIVYRAEEPNEDGDLVNRYHVVDGRRRLAAAKKLDWVGIKALVYDTELEALAAARTALAANLRSSNPLSEARAIDRLGLDGAKAVGGLTATEAKHRTMLLRLRPDLQTLLERGVLRETAARKLAQLPPEQQDTAWNRAQALAAEAGKKKVRVADVDDAVRERKAAMQPPIPIMAPNIVLAPPQTNEADWTPRMEAAANTIDCVLAEGLVPESMKEKLREVADFLRTW